MFKIGIIGDEDSVMPFKVLGIDSYPFNLIDDIDENKSKLKKLLENLVARNYSIIYITEEHSMMIMDVIERYKNLTVPMITIIPSIKKKFNIGISNIDKNIEKAIGKNIF